MSDRVKLWRLAMSCFVRRIIIYSWTANESPIEHVLRKVDRLLGNDLRILRHVGGTLSLIDWTFVRCCEKRFILRQKLL